MPKSRSIQLSIPTPCSQNWEEMSVNDKGRFCSSCNKSVIDFRNYSDQQLVDFFKRSKGNVCGHFRDNQLEKPMHNSQNRPLSPLLISAAMAIGFGNNLYATGKQIHSPVIQEVLNTEKKNEKNNSIARDSTRFISGKIVDQLTKLQVSGATLLIEGGRFAITADEKGTFSFFVPDHISADTVKLRIISNEHLDQTVVCAIKDLPLDLTIELRSACTLAYLPAGTIGRIRSTDPPAELKSISPIESLSGTVGGVHYRRPTVWQRLKRLFR